MNTTNNGQTGMKILRSIKVKNVELHNRVVMAPMVPFGLSKGDGTMGGKLVEHYINRAQTGIGLIISQSFSVTSKLGIDDVAGVSSDAQIKDLRTIADVCHESNTKFFVQLAYPGFAYINGDTINHLAEDELIEIQNEFINAAKLCKKAGCDGIELHGAHGFFLNMLASPISNQRTDPYGGDVYGRLRLIHNIVDGIKRFADEDFIISYRMGWNDNLVQDIKTAQALENIGIEMLHVSSGIPSERTVELPNDFHFNQVVFTGTKIKAQVTIPVIIVNDIETLRRGDYLIEHDMCDFVGYGKPFLADENYFAKSTENPDYKACLKCKTCQWFSNGARCPVQVKSSKN